MAEQQVTATKPTFDTSIIRPEMRAGDFKIRGKGFTARRLGTIKKGLRTLHTLELMAQTIYKFQITKEPSDVNCRLIEAMCNEMVHYQDFQVKLYEYGWRPSTCRWAFWLVGFFFGFGSRLLGKRAIFRMGIWVESKAVHHYADLLKAIEWDDDTRKVIEKDQADEDGHISRWKKMLETT